MRSSALRAALPLVLLSRAALAQAGPGADRALAGATVAVTATKFPEDPAKLPASLTVVTGQELADRGIRDLRSALALVAGVQVAPGGDHGPASSVPALWGLKEFDAFLLVVDGVPWGGAFNPALGSLDLADVERIEVQRGAAAVMYGATSFVGVIQVIHRQPAEARGSGSLSAGSHGSGGATVGLRLPAWAGFDSSLAADLGRQGFADPRTGFTKSHLLWRNRTVAGDGSFHADLDAVALDQKPASPHPRVGKVLTGLVPLDANHNPDGAFLDERRAALNLGYDRQLPGGATWSTLLSTTRSNTSVLRGFLAEVSAGHPNAHGFRERIEQTDLYLDTRLSGALAASARFVVGLDHLHGTGTGRGGDFDYFVALDGANPPDGGALPPAADIRVDDRRDFTGLYGLVEWQVVPRLSVELGARLNQTRESRRTSTLDLGTRAWAGGADAHAEGRLTGSAGVSWALWQDGGDALRLFASAKDAFKPAAVDFGLDSPSRILNPETARSWEAGLKGRFLGGSLSAELAAFRMDMDGMVVSVTGAGGLPVLQNAGSQRFQGVEGSLAAVLAPDLVLRTAYSYHDARFTRFAFEFDPGVPTQLAGNRLEMSPFHLGSLALTWAPARGFSASLEAAYHGWLWLNKRNSAPAGGFTTLGASVGWRAGDWDLRLTGTNLTDRRSPVAESELGDAQYYRMPGRRADASVRFRF